MKKPSLNAQLADIFDFILTCEENERLNDKTAVAVRNMPRSPERKPS